VEVVDLLTTFINLERAGLPMQPAISNQQPATSNLATGNAVYYMMEADW
jgi:hypothetical protein